MNSFRAKNYAATPVMEDLRSLLGAQVDADWIQAFIARGFGWQVEVGNLVTGITGGGAGTVMDLDQPEFGVSVPSGFCCVPFDIQIAARPGLATTDSHTSDILIAVDRAAAWAGDGTTTAETPLNLRTNGNGACPLTCFSAATGDITDPTLTMTLGRATKLTDIQGTATTVNLQEIFLHYAPLRPPFLIGPCAMYGYWGGDIAVVGFASVNFLAFPSSLVSALA